MNKLIRINRCLFLQVVLFIVFHSPWKSLSSVKQKESVLIWRSISLLMYVSLTYFIDSCMFLGSGSLINERIMWNLITILHVGRIHIKNLMWLCIEMILLHNSMKDLWIMDSIKSRISKHYDWMDIALLLEVISLLLIYHIIRWFVLRTWVVVRDSRNSM